MTQMQRSKIAFVWTDTEWRQTTVYSDDYGVTWSTSEGVPVDVNDMRPLDSKYGCLLFMFAAVFVLTAVLVANLIQPKKITSCKACAGEGSIKSKQCNDCNGIGTVRASEVSSE